MKSTLKFNLNDGDDRMAFRRATKATDMAAVLFELIYNVPKSIERDIDSDKLLERYEVLEAFRNKLKELCDDYDINIDDLII
jgi:hypothetical protein